MKMEPFPIDRIKILSQQAIDILAKEKARWSHNRHSATYQTAEAILQKFQLLHLALDRDSSHTGDIFARVCAILPTAEKAFRSLPKNSDAQSEVQHNRGNFRNILSEIKSVAEKMQKGRFSGVSPHMLTDESFLDNLSAASSLPPSDDSDDASSGDNSFVEEFEELKLTVQCQWNECDVLHYAANPRSTQPDFSSICSELFPFDARLKLPSLLTAFVDPDVQPVVVLTRNEHDVMQDVEAIAEQFANVRIIAVPAGAVLAPFLGRDPQELPEHYFHFVSSKLSRSEYLSFLDMQLVDRTAITLSAASEAGAKQALALKEINIRMNKSCPTFTREKARLNATFSDICIEEVDDGEKIDSENYPETMDTIRRAMDRLTANGGQNRVSGEAQSPEGTQSPPPNIGNIKQSIKMGQFYWGPGGKSTVGFFCKYHGNSAFVTCGHQFHLYAEDPRSDPKSPYNAYIDPSGGEIVVDEFTDHAICKVRSVCTIIDRSPIAVQQIENAPILMPTTINPCALKWENDLYDFVANDAMANFYAFILSGESSPSVGRISVSSNTSVNQFHVKRHFTLNTGCKSGDSGSPVFLLDAKGGCSILGIVRGGDKSKTIVVPVSNIKMSIREKKLQVLKRMGVPDSCTYVEHPLEESTPSFESIIDMALTAFF